MFHKMSKRRSSTDLVAMLLAGEEKELVKKITKKKIEKRKRKWFEPGLKKPAKRTWKWVYLSKMVIFFRLACKFQLISSSLQIPIRDVKRADEVGWYRWDDGTIYQGDFFFTYKNVLSVISRSLALFRVGEWQDGKEHGYGVKISRFERYEGFWELGVMEGHGIKVIIEFLPCVPV